MIMRLHTVPKWTKHTCNSQHTTEHTEDHFCDAHPKQPSISEDVDHTVDVRLASEVESGADMSTGCDDDVFGEVRVQAMVDV